MILLSNENINIISHLFDGWDETMLWTCLQGHMGSAWTDNAVNPKSAQIIVGDFCFFAGVPNAELVKNIPADFQSDCILMIAQNEQWDGLIEQIYHDSHSKFMRYAFKKESDVFDDALLNSYIQALPPDCEIKPVDQPLYYSLLKEEWSRDLVSQFSTFAEYKANGLGFALLYRGELACGASSYTFYDKGIEIEIDTKEPLRRKGFALACASRLILECKKKNLYPSWDAANMGSVRLAEKLGYHFDKEYTTYSITDFKVRKKTLSHMSLRPLKDKDIAKFIKWVNQDYIAKWYDPTDEWIFEVKHRDDDFSWLNHFIVTAGDEDIGFCQYYDYAAGKETWHGSTEVTGTYSIDYFIGEKRCLGKGYGKEMIAALIELISQIPSAKRIIVEPDPQNKASCGVLLSAGFVYDKENKLYLLKLR